MPSARVQKREREKERAYWEAREAVVAGRASRMSSSVMATCFEMVKISETRDPLRVISVVTYLESESSEASHVGSQISTTSNLTQGEMRF